MWSLQTKACSGNFTLIRVAERFFSGVPHPYLLGVCCPNLIRLLIDVAGCVSGWLSIPDSGPDRQPVLSTGV
jgi:hypothetical protein